MGAFDQTIQKCALKFPIVVFRAASGCLKVMLDQILAYGKQTMPKIKIALAAIHSQHLLP